MNRYGEVGCSDTLLGALDHRREGQSERVQVVYGYNGASQFGYNLKSGVYTVYLSRDEDDIEGSVKGLMLGIAAHRAVMRECAARNSMPFQYESYNHTDNNHYYKFVSDSSIGARIPLNACRLY